MEAYRKKSGNDDLAVDYYPGMVSLLLTDGWNDSTYSFNMHIADWRAMNVAIEKCHNGEKA